MEQYYKDVCNEQLFLKEVGEYYANELPNALDQQTIAKAIYNELNECGAVENLIMSNETSVWIDTIAIGQDYEVVSNQEFCEDFTPEQEILKIGHEQKVLVRNY